MQNFVGYKTEVNEATGKLEKNGPSALRTIVWMRRAR